MIPILLLFAPLRAQDDEVTTTMTSTVDTTAYVEALRSRFTTCLAAEGTVIDATDADAVTETLQTAAPLLAVTESPCTASDEAAAACASAVAALSCDALAADLEDALHGRSAATAAAWATSYGSALGERIGACFAVEAGRELTEEESTDIEGFESLLARTIESTSGSCPVDVDRAAACTTAIAAMSCTKLGEALANEDVELLVTDFVSSCEGFLDCG